MNVLAGALRADAGTIAIDGAPYRPATPLDARRHGIALIHQELSLCPHLTVDREHPDGTRAGAVRASWTAWRPSAQAARPAPQLPAPRALAAAHASASCRSPPSRSWRSAARWRSRARILLMDEPTSSLQRADVDHLFALIRRLRAQGLGIVYISHFLEEIREIADVLHGAPRRAERGGRRHRRRDQRAARRPDGRAPGGEPVPGARRARRPARSSSPCRISPRRRPFARRASSSGGARCSGSRASWVRGAPRWSARSSGSTPPRPGRVTVGGTRPGPHASRSGSRRASGT